MLYIIILLCLLCTSSVIASTYFFYINKLNIKQAAIDKDNQEKYDIKRQQEEAEFEALLKSEIANL